MKATRLKSGWRLSLSDSEMNILREAVANYQLDGEEDMAHLSPAERAAYRKSFSFIRWPDDVDDRRGQS